MEHIFNIAINVEDGKIIKSIEENVEHQVINMICDEVKKIIFERNYWSRSQDDNAPLRAMVEKQIDNMLNENKEFILNTASKFLAEKLARSKAGKALLNMEGENK